MVKGLTNREMPSAEEPECGSRKDSRVWEFIWILPLKVFGGAAREAGDEGRRRHRSAGAFVSCSSNFLGNSSASY